MRRTPGKSVGIYFDAADKKLLIGWLQSCFIKKIQIKELTCQIINYNL